MKIEEKILNAFKKKYIHGVSSLIENRLYEEIGILQRFDLMDEIETLSNWKKNIQGIRYYAGDVTANSLVLYILGLTKTNPLPPHYYCEDCRMVKFIDSKSIKDGYDLKDKQCSCGGTMVGDGHNLNSLFLYRPDKISEPEFQFIIEEERYLVAIESIINSISGELTIRKDDKNREIILGHIRLRPSSLIIKIGYKLNQSPKKVTYYEMLLFLFEYFGGFSKNTKNLQFLNPYNFTLSKSVDIDNALQVIGINHGDWKLNKINRYSQLNWVKEDNGFLEVQDNLTSFPILYDDIYGMFDGSSLEYRDELLKLCDKAHYGSLGIKKNSEISSESLWFLNHCNRRISRAEALEILHLQYFCGR